MSYNKCNVISSVASGDGEDQKSSSANMFAQARYALPIYILHPKDRRKYLS